MIFWARKETDFTDLAPMPEESPKDEAAKNELSKYEPTTLEKVFELLDIKLVTFGIPGALSFVGITNVREGKWTEAGYYFLGAAGVWIAIKVGKKLAPKFEQMLDWGIAETEKALLERWTAIRSDFTGPYLRQQARLCEEFTVEGFNPDRTAIPLLEDVFVPLDLSGALGSGIVTLDDRPDRRGSKGRSSKGHVAKISLTSEHLSIWHLLAHLAKRSYLSPNEHPSQRRHGQNHPPAPRRPDLRPTATPPLSGS
jgi:hypothetical protein